MRLDKITTAAAALAAGLFVLTSAAPALAGPAPEEAASCRHKDISWHTETVFLKTTKGKYAPVTLPVHSITYTTVKDFWIQVCKQGSGHRTCDSKWH
jgi:hypothetical protein